MATEKNYFKELNALNVGDKTEKKNNLTYLSWAWAWAELKKLYPESFYTIYENKDGWFYHTDGKTAWVKTGVTVCNIEHIEFLPVMDFRNQSITAEKITSFDVNKAIQRSLTKAVARHGVGLYIYAGEDLPEDTQSDMPEEERVDAKKKIGKAHIDMIRRVLTLMGKKEDDYLTYIEYKKLTDITIDDFTLRLKPQLEEWEKAKAAKK